MNNLCYLIKRLSLFPACVIYSPFVALSIFVILSNLCRIIKLLSSWGFELCFLRIYFSLVISQDIPSCEIFSRAAFNKSVGAVLQIQYVHSLLFNIDEISIVRGMSGKT